MNRGRWEEEYFRLNPENWFPGRRNSGGNASAFRYFLMIVLSALYLISIANGIRMMTDAPYIVSAIFAGGLHLLRYFFLRRQSALELLTSNGWDRVIGYLVTSIVSTTIAAYGIYGFGMTVIAASEVALETGVIPASSFAPQSDGAVVRRMIEERLRQKERDLELLIEAGGSSPQNISEITILMGEVRGLRDLFLVLPKLPPDPKPDGANLDRNLVVDPGAAETRQTPPLVTGTPAPILKLTPEGDGPGTGKQIGPIGVSENPVEGLSGFIDRTLKQESIVIVCWIAAGILEGLLTILAVFGRSRHRYW